VVITEATRPVPHMPSSTQAYRPVTTSVRATPRPSVALAKQGPSLSVAVETAPPIGVKVRRG
jgi:hypothetical protein